MIEVHLIGHTSDLRYLVFGDDPDSADGRYLVAVDPDLFLTVDDVREARVDAGLPVGPPGDQSEPAAEVGEVVALDQGTDDPDDGSADAEPAAVDEPTPTAASVLSPARIQALLRAGRSPQAVAKLAGTDVAWVERWLPPILEERAQVIREARAATLTRPRLGRSRRAVGEAVAANLTARDVADDDVTWTATRRSDGWWTVTIRYRSGGRNQQASWRYHRESRRIEPSSDLARDLGFVRPARSR
ncbi:MAG: septation protein SepH [Nitriliruptorales bacterium]